MSHDSMLRTGRRATFIAYAAMLVVTVLGFLLVRQFGERLEAPAAASAGETTKPAGAGDALFHVLLALAAVIVAGRALGAAFRYVGQPPVIGEVVAGILLGPSLLGRVAPGAYAYLLPQSVAPHLGVLSQIG